jgi:predicted phosphate transport protein (TIGR00153 family)
MRAAEHAGDEATHAIMRELNETFVTPFDREDIYRLASSLDDVMDAMEAAVDLVVLYQIGDLPSEIADQVDVLERAAELTAAAMPRLRSMKDLSDYWIELNRLENQADQVYRRLLARLFSGEYDALTVMKLKEVVDQLEAAADAFEHVANTVETIAVKES